MDRSAAWKGSLNEAELPIEVDCWNKPGIRLKNNCLGPQGLGVCQVGLDEALTNVHAAVEAGHSQLGELKLLVRVSEETTSPDDIATAVGDEYGSAGL